MIRTPFRRIVNIWAATVLMVQVLILPNVVIAQEEVASALRRFKDREVSTGYYEEYEVLPRRQQPLISDPRSQKGHFSLQSDGGPGAYPDALSRLSPGHQVL